MYYLPLSEISGGGVTTFLRLTDTPDTYIPNKTVIVNPTGNGLIFGDPEGLPTGTAGDTLRYDGINWLSNKQIENTGTNVYIGEPLGGSVTAHTLAVFPHDANDFCGKVGIGTNTVNEGYRCQIKGDMRQTCSHGLYGLADTLLGQFPVIAAEQWMYVIGYDDVLFLGGASNSFISIADPCNVVEISTIPLTMAIKQTAIYGNYLYNTNGGLGFVILDISNLYNPVVVKNQGFPGSRHCCCINKGYLYIFRDNRYIDVYSLADPLNPSLVYTYQETDFEFRVSWAVEKGDCLILASTNSIDMGLIATYDISNPLNITKTFLRYFPGCDRLYKLHVSDNNKCYFSYNLGGTSTYVDTYDILSTTIGYLGTYNFPSYMTRCRGLHVQGNHMYIVDNDSIGLTNLQLYDITNPNNFVLIREYLSASGILNEATDLYLKDDILYILQSGSGINDNSVITVTANTLQHFGGFQSNGILKSNTIRSRHLYLSSAVIPNTISDGGCLFVRSTDGKLYFLDYDGIVHQISDTFLGLTDTPNAYIPNKAVIVNSTGDGLIFKDPPELPAGTAGDTLRYDGSAWVSNKHIENHGTDVFVGAPLGGSITERTLSVLTPITGDGSGRVGINTNSVGQGYKLQVNGDIKQIVSEGTYGAFGTILGNFNVDAAQRWFRDPIRTDIAYIGGTVPQVISIFDPYNVKTLTTFPIPMYVPKMAVYDKYLYYVENYSSIRKIHIFDVSDSYHPIEMSPVVVDPGAGDFLSACIEGTNLFIFRKDKYIDVYTLTNPLNPTFVTTYTENLYVLYGSVWMTCKDNRLCIAGMGIGDTGNVAIYDVSGLPVITQLTTTSYGDFYPQRVIVYDNVFYILWILASGSTNGSYLSIYNKSTGAKLFDITLDAALMRSNGITTSPNRLYIVDSAIPPNGTLAIYDISDTSNPVFLTFVPSLSSTLYYAADLIYDDNILYILQAGEFTGDEFITTVSVDVIEYFGGFESNGLLKGNELQGRNIRLPVAATPPAIANTGQLFVRASDKKLCFLDPNGVVHQIT